MKEISLSRCSRLTTGLAFINLNTYAILSSREPRNLKLQLTPEQLTSFPLTYDPNPLIIHGSEVVFQTCIVEV